MANECKNVISFSIIFAGGSKIIGSRKRASGRLQHLRRRPRPASSLASSARNIALKQILFSLSFSTLTSCVSNISGLTARPGPVASKAFSLNGG
jgi:hypothetical protein